MIIFLLATFACLIALSKGFSPTAYKIFVRKGFNSITRRACSSIENDLLISSDSTDDQPIEEEEPIENESIEDFEERFSSKKSSPLDQFLNALRTSIDEGTMLKLVLSENEYSDDNNDDDDIGEEGSSNDKDKAEIDWQQVKDWSAMCGRLIKTKSESRLQLISYKDKSMKKSDQTKNYSSSEETARIISIYLRYSFKKAMLSTKENDYEYKLRGKGQGKFRSTSKVR